jgi:hypothetical protein
LFNGAALSNGIPIRIYKQYDSLYDKLRFSNNQLWIGSIEATKPTSAILSVRFEDMCHFDRFCLVEQ